MTIPLIETDKNLENAGARGAREFFYLSGGIMAINFFSHTFFLSFSIINMFLYVFSLAMGLLALAKSTEPKVLLKMTSKQLTFFHRYGEVNMPWDLIQRIDEVTVNHLYGRQPLGFIGVKFKRPDDFYQAIPLRLAGRLLTEQKVIIHRLARFQNYTTAEVLELFSHKLDYKTESGERYTGVTAMFINRCETFNKELGFHFYIPCESCVLSTNETVNLLNSSLKSSIKSKS